MTRIRVAREAADELAEAVLWYEGRREGLGRELLDSVAATLPVIANRPRAFPRLQDVSETFEIRRALLDRFPFGIVFLVHTGEIRVLAIAHAKRQPGYWLNRVRK